MRILHVNKFLYRRGGAEAYMLELAQMQRSLGHDVEFFGMDHPDNDPMRYREHFPSHAEFEPAPPGSGARLRLAARMLWSREARAGMDRVMQQFQPDVVHLHNIYHQLSPSVLAPVGARKTPAVMTLHDYKMACPTYQLLDTNEANGGPRLCTGCIDNGLRQAVKRACKSGSRAASTVAALEVGAHRAFGAYDPVSTFICPSDFLRRIMVSAAVYPDRMRVLDNFTTIPASTRPDAGEGLLFFGRLSHEKGVDVLIDAYRIVAERQPGGLPPLHIAGEGPDGDQLRAQAVGTGLDIRFHGRLAKPDLTRLLLSSRASVVPSRWYENQPLSVLESLASGVPVVATNLGGLPDLVQHGRTGLIVEAESSTALASALEEYLRKPDLADAHGKAARREAETRFNPELHVAEILGIYESIGVPKSNEMRQRIT